MVTRATNQHGKDWKGLLYRLHKISKDILYDTSDEYEGKWIEIMLIKKLK
jgi:hypothetical protein